MFDQTGFNYDLLTFDEAIERHGMMQEALAQLAQTPDKARAKTIAGMALDTWNESMGAGDPDSLIASVVRAVMPIDYIPLLSMRSGIPAAYFNVALVQKLQNVADLNDDLQLKAAVTEAFSSFEEKRNNASTMEEGFGFDRAAAWVQMRKVEDRSVQVSDLMLEVAKLAGRMYKSFQYAGIPKKTDDPQEVDGITIGGDLSRMLDDEAASLGVDPEVVVRVSEDRAVLHNMQGESVKSRGPLVVAVDESGSMHGHREVWSKACAVALARVALQEKRTVRIVHFSTVTDVQPILNDTDDIRLIAESHCGGGTDIETAMRVCVRQVGDLEITGEHGADIVFITDGEDQYEESPFIEAKKLGVQLWTVAIDVDIKAKAARTREHRGFGGGASGHLYTYAKAYVHLSDKVIRASGDGAIMAAMQLRDAALDNSTREANHVDT